MKVVILHPPLYPVNHELFNLLGKDVELVVYSFGEQPGFHNHWKVADYDSKECSYTLKVLKGSTNLKRFAVSYSLQMNPIVFKYLLDEKPDIVISVAFWMPSFYASIFKVILKYKFLIITDAIKATEINISKNRKRMRKYILSKTNLVLSGSNLTTEYIRSLDNNVKTELSLQTIDVRQWQIDIDNIPTKEELKKELNIPEKYKILLGIGSFIELKNWLSVYNLITTTNDYFFILIGEGDELDKYKDYIRIHNLENKTLILPKQYDVSLKKYYKVADLFVFPSLRDTFGYVVSEALASGLPVLCSNKAGASTLIKHKINGMIIEPEKYFIREINYVFDHLELMKEQAKDTMQTFTLENKKDKIKMILKKLTTEEK